MKEKIPRAAVNLSFSFRPLELELGLIIFEIFEPVDELLLLIELVKDFL